MIVLVLTVTCRSTRGIVAAISAYLADKGCNILVARNSTTWKPAVSGELDAGA